MLQHWRRNVNGCREMLVKDIEVYVPVKVAVKDFDTNISAGKKLVVVRELEAVTHGVVDHEERTTGDSNMNIENTEISMNGDLQAIAPKRIRRPLKRHLHPNSCRLSIFTR
jgi:hypothetical protein